MFDPVKDVFTGVRFTKQRLANLLLNQSEGGQDEETVTADDGHEHVGHLSECSDALDPQG